MTEDYVKEVKSLRAKIDNLHKTHRESVEQTIKQLNNLFEKCDHKHPDGSSAISGGMFMSSCDICNWCDL